eukprot:6492661-Amphidinium_carterae.3
MCAQLFPEDNKADAINLFSLDEVELLKNSTLPWDWGRVMRQSFQTMPPRGKYTNRLEPVAQDGPYSIVAVVAHCHARWEKDFEAGAADVGKRFLRKRLDEHGLRYEELANTTVTTWSIEGLVVMPAWRVVQARGTAFAPIDVSAVDSRQIVHNLLLLQCKEGLRATIEYPILSAAYFAVPIQLPASLTGEFENYALPVEKPSIVGPMWAAMQGAEVTIVDESGRTSTKTALALWTQWSQQYRLGAISPTSCLVGWRAWRPVAALMVRFGWFGDAVAVAQRNSGRFSTRLRTEAPPAKLLRQYLEWKVAPPNMQVESEAFSNFHSLLRFTPKLPDTNPTHSRHNPDTAQ